MTMEAAEVAKVTEITSPEATPRIHAAEPAELYPWLPCTVTLDLPIAHFTVRNLLALAPGAILETATKPTSDVPLQANGVLIGWAEFEVIGNMLTVRITELA